MVRLRDETFNANDTAGRITTSNPYVQDAIEAIARRAELIGDGTKCGDSCRAELRGKADLWQAEAQNDAGGRVLTYTEPYGPDGPRRGTTVKLLHSPGMGRWQEFTCLNSLREVEPGVKLIVSDGGLDELNARESEATPEGAGEVTA
jgi:hypothetical protein